MFTGIIEAIGVVDTIERRGVDSRIRVDAPDLGFDGVREGDSVCVSGTCLTAVALAGSGFCADVVRRDTGTHATGRAGAGFERQLGEVAHAINAAGRTSGDRGTWTAWRP